MIHKEEFLGQGKEREKKGKGNSLCVLLRQLSTRLPRLPLAQKNMHPPRSCSNISSKWLNALKGVIDSAVVFEYRGSVPLEKHSRPPGGQYPSEAASTRLVLGIREGQR